jgi:hypothetical protein
MAVARAEKAVARSGDHMVTKNGAMPEYHPGRGWIKKDLVPRGLPTTLAAFAASAGREIPA